ncbi:MAG: autotransporter outer membrane beta-barrel domain-containing protein [Planctomycetaceae bacterium]|nr:autotransporter outer membrane beta-barrel domain-containing protein [Planctomycetaceae bacterium]
MIYIQRFTFLLVFSALATFVSAADLFSLDEINKPFRTEQTAIDDNRFTPAVTANSVRFETDIDLFLGQKRRRGSGGRFWSNIYYGATALKPRDFVEVDPSALGLQLGFDLVQAHGVYSTFFGGFQRSSVKMHDIAKSTAETCTIGYGKFVYLRGCHFGGIGTVSYDKYKIRRSIINPNGDGEGLQTNIYGEFGIDFVMAKFAIKPFYGLQYDFLYHGRIGEKGAAFQGDWNGSSIMQLLGSKFNVSPLDSIEFQLRTVWLHELLNPQPFFNSRFGPVQGTMTPAIFFYDGYTGRDWAWLGVSFKWEMVYKVFLFLDYDVTLNKYQTTHFGNIGLCLGW